MLTKVETEFGTFEVSTNSDGETVAFGTYTSPESQVDFGYAPNHNVIVNWMRTEFDGFTSDSPNYRNVYVEGSV
jgi:hypothetical protein